MSIQLDEIFSKSLDIGITDLENALNVKLPEDYKQFLDKWNGGIPSLGTFIINDAEGKSSVSLFYGFTDDDDYSIIDNAILFDNDYENSYMPIGHDPGGNKIVVCISGNDFGKVYFCDHEVAPPKNLYLIANSFTEFLEKLY